jgi:hypothetical protein
MIAPPILIILDDYDTSYKLRGVRLIQAMFSKVDVTALRKSGLGKVFIEVKPTACNRFLPMESNSSTNQRLSESLPMSNLCSW